MENVKKCAKCGNELPISQFYKRRLSGGDPGAQAYCKNCAMVAKAVWRRNNPEKQKKIRARSYQNNKEEEVTRSARRRVERPEECRMSAAKSYQKYKDERNLRRNVYARERRIHDLSFRIRSSIRSNMGSALKGNAKSGHTTELLGCSIESLRDHLERQFKPGMTWDNYGYRGWHIDHIIPLSYFDMSNPEQQRRAWHYTNLQPLWAVDNMRKGNKIEERQLILL